MGVVACGNIHCALSVFEDPLIRHRSVKPSKQAVVECPIGSTNIYCLSASGCQLVISSGLEFPFGIGVISTERLGRQVTAVFTVNATA